MLDQALFGKNCLVGDVWQLYEFTDEIATHKLELLGCILLIACLDAKLEFVWVGLTERKMICPPLLFGIASHEFCLFVHLCFCACAEGVLPDFCFLCSLHMHAPSLLEQVTVCNVYCLGTSTAFCSSCYGCERRIEGRSTSCRTCCH